MSKYTDTSKKFVDNLIRDVLPIMRQEMKGWVKGKDLKIRYSDREQFLISLARYVSKIDGCLQRQQVFPKLIQSYSASYEKLGFSRVAQLIYHIENYLSEVYIFHERTIAFLKYLKKECKKIGEQDLMILIEDVTGAFVETLEPIIRTRGVHTHVERFSDEQLSDLETIDLGFQLEMKKNKKSKQIHYFKMARKIKLLAVRRKWKSTFKKNYEVFKELLDQIYYILDKKRIIKVIIDKKCNS